MRAEVKLKPSLPRQGDPYEFWYCGPYALAVIAGIQYHEAYDFCGKHAYRFRRGLFGHGHLHMNDMKKVLRHAGFHIKWNYNKTYYPTWMPYGDRPRYWSWDYSPSRPTSAQLPGFTKIEDFKWEKGKTYLLASQEHYYTLYNGKVYHCSDDHPTELGLASMSNHQLLAWTEVTPLHPSTGRRKAAAPPSGKSRARTA